MQNCGYNVRSSQFAVRSSLICPFVIPLKNFSCAFIAEVLL